jgi:hypothetical protein
LCNIEHRPTGNWRIADSIRDKPFGHRVNILARNLPEIASQTTDLEKSI